MAHGRKGAPGSFGAPLDQLLPRFAGDAEAPAISVDVHRCPEPDTEADDEPRRCRIFLLNQRLYERAAEAPSRRPPTRSDAGLLSRDG